MKATRKGNRLYITKRYDGSVIGVSKSIKGKAFQSQGDDDYWSNYDLDDATPRQLGMRL